MRTVTFKRDPNLTVPAPLPFEVAEELPSLEKGKCPPIHSAQDIPRYSEKHKLPFEASQGGAQTMHPEYARRLEELMNRAAPSSSAKK